MSKRFDRRTLVQSGAVLGAAALAGAPRLASPARAQDAITLTWWDYYDGANGDAIQAQLDSYKSVKPNVTIERTLIPFADLKQKLLQGAAAGDLPDIVVIDNPDHQAFASGARPPGACRARANRSRTRGLQPTDRRRWTPPDLEPRVRRGCARRRGRAADPSLHGGMGGPGDHCGRLHSSGSGRGSRSRWPKGPPGPKAQAAKRTPISS